MTYTRTTWQDNVTLVDAAKMNNIETELVALDPVLSRVVVPTVVNGQWLKGAGGAAVWSAITAADVSGLPGQELTYAETTANVSVTATSDASANLVVAAPAFTFDGSGVIVTLAAPGALTPPVAAQVIFAVLFQDGAPVGRLAAVMSSANAQAAAPLYGQRRMYPSAGSHQFSFAASVSSGTGTVLAGGTGSGTYMPAFIRITRG